MLLLYTKDKKSNIKWDKLKMIKKNGIGGNYYNVEGNNNNEDLINQLHSFRREESNLEKFLDVKKGVIMNEKEEEKIKRDWIIYNAKLAEETFPKQPLTLGEYKKLRNYKVDNLNVDINKQSSDALVAVTEGPTHNLFKWASPIYESFGSVKKMISTGCHPDEVWMSVLFQLVHSFIVMEENGIVFDSFGIDKNVFIKDIKFDATNYGHWVYCVGNINFYVPNYGYVLLIDSKYGDLEFDNITIDKYDVKPSERRYKVYLSGFGSNGKGDEYFVNNKQKAKEKIRKQFKQAINPENFTSVGKARGVGRPSNEVLKFMTTLYNAPDKSSMREILLTYFRFFMHNRAGSLLTYNEKVMVNMMKLPKFKQGELIVYAERYDTYRWGIYLGPSESVTNKVKVYLGEAGVKDIFKTRLLSVPEGQYVSQSSSKNLKLDPDSLIETYNLE